MTLTLPAAVDIDHFEIDPAEGCADGPAAAAERVTDRDRDDDGSGRAVDAGEVADLRLRGPAPQERRRAGRRYGDGSAPGSGDDRVQPGRRRVPGHDRVRDSTPSRRRRHPRRRHADADAHAATTPTPTSTPTPTPTATPEPAPTRRPAFDPDTDRHAHRSADRDARPAPGLPARRVRQAVCARQGALPEGVRRQRRPDGRREHGAHELRLGSSRSAGSLRRSLKAGSATLTVTLGARPAAGSRT